MDLPLLVLGRDDLRTTLVLLGLVVILVSAMIRKHKRVADRRRTDEQDTAAREASLLEHAGRTHSRH